MVNSWEMLINPKSRMEALASPGSLAVELLGPGFIPRIWISRHFNKISLVYFWRFWLQKSLVRLEHFASKHISNDISATGPPTTLCSMMSGITVSKLWEKELVMDREALCAEVHGVTESGTTEQQNWTELHSLYIYLFLQLTLTPFLKINIYHLFSASLSDRT